MRLIMNRHSDPATYDAWPRHPEASFDMTDRVIPLVDARRAMPLPDVGRWDAAAGSVVDTLARPLHDLRISVTDRCNFRCTYCMPKEVFGADYEFLPRSEILTFEEITRLARIFEEHGVEKIRLTGGEPLLRRNLERLIEMLREPRRPRPHADDERLAARAQGARAARRGPRARHREPRLARRRGVPGDERRRLPGRARARGHRGRGGGRARADQDQHGGEARRERPHDRRRWRATSAAPATSCASSSTWTSARPTAGAWTTSCPRPRSSAAISRELPLEPVDANYYGEVAERWRYRDGSGEIGVIASVTQAFCRDLHARAALDRRQALHVPLRDRGHDLRALLRGGASRRRRPRRDRARSGGRAATATPRSAPPRRRRRGRSRCRTSADEDAPQTARSPTPPARSPSRSRR